MQSIARVCKWLCIGGLAASCGAWAQSFPTRPVRILVGYVAGGPADLTARRLAAVLQRELGQPVIVDNRPGATGLIASQQTAHAEADGYTLLLVANATITMSSHLAKNLTFDPIRDFTPISNVVDSTLVLLVSKDLPVKSLSDLIGVAKAKPEEITFGSAGIGSAPHLATELLKKMTSTSMLHVPYKGNALALADVIGGKISFVWYDLGGASPFVKAGQVRALAVSSKVRNGRLPEVPTAVEAGLPGFDVWVWYALGGPPNLSPAIVSRIGAALRNALTDPELVRYLSDNGYDVAPSTAEALRARIQADYALWGDVVRGMKLE